MTEENILIVGIDPASHKSAYVPIELTSTSEGWSAKIGGPYPKVLPNELNDLITEWKGKKALLVWDAPLTGPKNPGDSDRFNWCKGDFSIRPLESELGAKLLKQERSRIGEENILGNVVPGISVKHYTGCSHWAITRALLGLPRVGRFDAPISSLPFTPIFENADHSNSTGMLGKNPCVVETHPAVALWCWLHNAEKEEPRSWTYKGRDDKQDLNKRRTGMLNALLGIWREQFCGHAAKLEDTAHMESFARNDDHFDALIAAMLGLLWATSADAVKVYGSQAKGAMLLPKTLCLEGL